MRLRGSIRAMRPPECARACDPPRAALYPPQPPSQPAIMRAASMGRMNPKRSAIMRCFICAHPKGVAVDSRHQAYTHTIGRKGAISLKTALFCRAPLTRPPLRGFSSSVPTRHAAMRGRFRRRMFRVLRRRPPGDRRGGHGVGVFVCVAKHSGVSGIGAAAARQPHSRGMKLTQALSSVTMPFCRSSN